MPGRFVLYLIFSLALLSNRLVIAQYDSTLILPTVEIVASPLFPSLTGLSIVVIDSALRCRSGFLPVSELLLQHSSVIVRNYGPGTLANISMRGSSSSHTGVFWNGIPINPPNILMIDASLLPCSFFDEIAIVPGGGSVNSGSGSIGGSVFLNDKAVFNNGVSASAAIDYASFTTHGYSAKMDYSVKKFHTSLSYFHQDSENDFPYVNTTAFGNPIENLKNAGYNQDGLKQSISIHLPYNQMMLLSAWYSNSFRQIPGSLTSRTLRAHQEDESLKSLMQYRRYSGKLDLSLRISAINDLIRYVDKDFFLDSRFSTISYFAESEILYRLSDNYSISGGLRGLWQDAKVSAYSNFKTQNQHSVFTRFSAKLFNKSLALDLALRKEFTDNYLIPLLPSAGINYHFLKYFTYSAAASLNYRLPSLNDRFWMPGGNPELKPEQSRNVESGIGCELKTGKSNVVSLRTTVFSNHITNWIEWLPGASGIWSAENAREVRTSGLEAKGKTIYSKGSFLILLAADYTYIQSINLVERMPGDNSVGRQLIYVPKHKANIRFDLGYAFFLNGFNATYLGQQFTNASNTASLPECMVLNYFAEFKLFNTSKLNVIMTLQVRNLTSTTYQLIEYRPMPGISYHFGIKFNYK